VSASVILLGANFAHHVLLAIMCGNFFEFADTRDGGSSFWCHHRKAYASKKKTGSGRAWPNPAPGGATACADAGDDSVAAWADGTCMT